LRQSGWQIADRANADHILVLLIDTFFPLDDPQANLLLV
jgi:hypothetical protein